MFGDVFWTSVQEFWHIFIILLGICVLFFLYLRKQAKDADIESHLNLKTFSNQDDEDIEDDDDHKDESKTISLQSQPIIRSPIIGTTSVTLEEQMVMNRPEIILP